MEDAIRKAEQVILGEINEDECYEAVFNARFGQGYPCNSCGRATRWFRLSKVRAYSCQYCGNHLHPTAGTLLEGTKLPVRYWLLATYLQKIQPKGVTPVDLKRRLPISYLTARRVSRIIRSNITPGSVPCYQTALSIPSLLVDISKVSEQAKARKTPAALTMVEKALVAVPFLWLVDAVGEVIPGWLDVMVSA